MTATLVSDGRAIDVRIRDLSAGGAQVDGCELPDVGTAMMLVRGGLSVRGHVTWSAERRCGLNFAQRIAVPAWMANPTGGEQQRVDHLVAVAKTGEARPAAGGSWVGTPEALADDLNRVSRLLERVGEQLAGDPTVVAAHGARLENLAIALQTITALAAMAVEGGGYGESEHRRKLEELRTRGVQALIGEG